MSKRVHLCLTLIAGLCLATVAGGQQPVIKITSEKVKPPMSGKGLMPDQKTPDGWHKSEKYPGNWYLQHQGFPAAYYEPKTGAYEVLDSKSASWVKSVPPWIGQPSPWPLPWEPVQAPTSPENLGIDLDDLKGSGYTVNGQCVTREEWLRTVNGGIYLTGPEAPPPPDDSGKWRLTIIRDPNKVSDADWKKLCADLDSPALADFRSKVHLHRYEDPNHWHLEGFKLGQDARFKAAGLLIALQEPADVNQRTSPIVQARYTYAGADALRRIDPAFDPNKTPDGTSTGLQLDTRTKLLIGGGLLGLLLLYLAYAGKLKLPEKTAGPPPIRADPARVNSTTRKEQLYDALVDVMEQEKAALAAEAARKAKAEKVDQFFGKVEAAAKE